MDITTTHRSGREIATHIRAHRDTAESVIMLASNLRYNVEAHPNKHPGGFAVRIVAKGSETPETWAVVGYSAMDLSRCDVDITEIVALAVEYTKQWITNRVGGEVVVKLAQDRVRDEMRDIARDYPDGRFPLTIGERYGVLKTLSLLSPSDPVSLKELLEAKFITPEDLPERTDRSSPVDRVTQGLMHVNMAIQLVRDNKEKIVGLWEELTTAQHELSAALERVAKGGRI